MATGLDNLKIYKMAEEAEIEVHKLTERYTEIIKAISGYIRFLWK